jgi:uncharacterized membrane protein
MAFRAGAAHTLSASQIARAMAKPEVEKFLRAAGLVFVFAWFLLGGIGHFTRHAFFVAIMPPLIPFPHAIVWATGLCEIAGALALVNTRLRALSGLCLVALCICVVPVHVEMLREPRWIRAYGAAALWGRLAFQPVLMAIIFFSTRFRGKPRV